MTEICKIADIPIVEETGRLTLSAEADATADCYEASVLINGQEKAVFLLQQDGNISAYINACPHTGVPLNWQPGLFLDSEKSYIQCSVHGALFEKDSGLCIHGPCVNQSLEPVDIEIKGESVYLKGG